MALRALAWMKIETHVPRELDRNTLVNIDTCVDVVDFIKFFSSI